MEFTVTYDRCVWTTGKVNVIADTEEDAEKLVYDMECNGTLDRNNEIVEPNGDEINVINVEAKEVKSTYRIHYAYIHKEYIDVKATSKEEAIKLFDPSKYAFGIHEEGYGDEEITFVEQLEKEEEQC